jgi:hypothetical protein
VGGGRHRRRAAPSGRYLQGCDSGGATGFPKLRAKFEPVAGNAVLWYNIDRHGQLDERTLHAGEPVVAGEKWGMNIWLRERPRPKRTPPPPDVDASIAPAGATEPATTAPIAAGPAAPPETAAAPPVSPPPAPKPPAARPAAVQPGAVVCPACGDLAGPIGLCLCKANYGAWRGAGAAP